MNRDFDHNLTLETVLEITINLAAFAEIMYTGRQLQICGHTCTYDKSISEIQYYFETITNGILIAYTEGRRGK